MPSESTLRFLYLGQFVHELPQMAAYTVQEAAEEDGSSHGVSPRKETTVTFDP